MDSETLVPWDYDVARMERNKLVSYDEDLLSDAVDKICKGILDYISPAWNMAPYYMESYILNNSRLDSLGTCSRFLEFCKRNKSKFDKFMESYSRVGIYPKRDVLPPDYDLPNEMPHYDNVRESYSNFKRFDTVFDHSDHLFSTKPMEKAQEAWFAWMRKEREILKQHLPETIFVRVYEPRMDLLRAVIVGPKGTPYQDGLFFFDVYFSSMYPLEDPLVRYHSGGFGINPYIFECGEVRFNLIKGFTWSGQTLRVSESTTMLQLLLTIQDRVLNADPLFHQPRFLDSGPSVAAEYMSLLYNEDILIKSLETMIYTMNKPPKNFEAFVVGHFHSRVVDILRACEAYMRGQKVGGNEESFCSIEFRKNVETCFWRLIDCFIKIGATEAYKFKALTALTSEQNNQLVWNGLPQHQLQAPSEILEEVKHLDNWQTHSKNSSVASESLISNKSVSSASESLISNKSVSGLFREAFSCLNLCGIMKFLIIILAYFVVSLMLDQVQQWLPSK